MEETKLYMGFRKSEYTDKLVVQIVMPSYDLRNVWVCDMANEEDMEKLKDIARQYRNLNLDGETVHFGPHGACIAVKYILHDANGVISEIILFEMTPEEFEAQRPRVEKEEEQLFKPENNVGKGLLN